MVQGRPVEADVLVWDTKVRVASFPQLQDLAGAAGVVLITVVVLALLVIHQHQHLAQNHQPVSLVSIISRSAASQR